MLDILGVGVALPPARLVAELVREAGGDPAVHTGWERACVATERDHPSTLSRVALSNALTQAGIEGAQLDLVIAAGVSRDYPASWSTATDVMSEVGASGQCVGFDLTVGCAGTLVALNTAIGWLREMGGGYAAIVAAERWSETIDRKNAGERALWAHADGGGALVVAVDRPGLPLARFHGAAFTSNARYNGLVRIKYGGTRFPRAPADEPSSGRTLTPISSGELAGAYERGYSEACEKMLQRSHVPFGRVICNQISPTIVSLIGKAAGVEDDLVVRTGHEFGHLGGADVIVGLQRLSDAGSIDRPLAIAASASYAFGVGLLTPR